jgi:homospermidine synthase
MMDFQLPYGSHMKYIPLCNRQKYVQKAVVFLPGTGVNHCMVTKH